jgi:AraC-like DNA-binding protein
MRALVSYVERTGVERARFLVEAGLTAAQLADLSAYIPLEDYRRAIVAALSTTGDPAIGLHMGEHASIASFDVLGHLVEQSRCLREALELASRYARIATEGPELELCEEGDAATICLTQLSGESPEERVSAEFTTSALLTLVRRFVGSGAEVRRAFFPYEAPRHRSEYTRVFGGREQFSHAFTGLEIERSWLDLEQLCRSPDLHALLYKRAELTLAKMERDSSAAERVKRWLASQNLQTRPTMDVVAHELGTSARSLRRRLRGESVLFDELVDAALSARAKELLADPRRSVKETAFAMGFRSPAAFAHAFKRWTGMTPSAYRARR